MCLELQMIYNGDAELLLSTKAVFYVLVMMDKYYPVIQDSFDCLS